MKPSLLRTRPRLRKPIADTLHHAKLRALVLFMKHTLLLWVSPLSMASCQDSEFEKMRQSHGKIKTLAGMRKEDKDQNSWKARYEGKPATEVELSNPHITMRDSVGNDYIADKQSN